MLLKFHTKASIIFVTNSFSYHKIKPLISIQQQSPPISQKKESFTSFIIIGILLILTSHSFISIFSIAVRLGEYNLATDPDCVTNDFNETTCTDNSQVITDISVLKYQFYNIKGYEDIGLIRLNTPANLTHNNINTICLPFAYDAANIINQYYVTGWGRTADNETMSNELLGAFVPFVPRLECTKIMGTPITKYHICAGKAGEELSDFLQ